MQSGTSLHLFQKHLKPFCKGTKSSISGKPEDETKTMTTCLVCWQSLPIYPNCQPSNPLSTYAMQTPKRITVELPGLFVNGNETCYRLYHSIHLSGGTLWWLGSCWPSGKVAWTCCFYSDLRTEILICGSVMALVYSLLIFAPMCRDGGSKIKQDQGPFPFKPPGRPTKKHQNPQRWPRGWAPNVATSRRSPETENHLPKFATWGCLWGDDRSIDLKIFRFGLEEYWTSSSQLARLDSSLSMHPGEANKHQTPLKNPLSTCGQLHHFYILEYSMRINHT